MSSISAPRRRPRGCLPFLGRRPRIRYVDRADDACGNGRCRQRPGWSRLPRSDG